MSDIEPGSGFLSIGEVLTMLLEEFPDVTISKIRFLESQGLISPERTASGYRKFYQDDIDLLRVILTEQRENFLPLRVIRTRLETGQIDPTGEHLRPAPFDDDELDAPTDGTEDDTPDGRRLAGASRGEDQSAALAALVNDPGDDAAHDAAHNAAHGAADVGTSGSSPKPDARTRWIEPGEAPTSPSLPAGAAVSRAEFLDLARITAAELDALESFGVVAPRQIGERRVYDQAALRVALPAAEFLRQGIDARHLRQWRTAAEREASLYEQLVAPRLRQRNPTATATAIEQLKLLDRLGMQLRNAMMHQLLGPQIDAD